MIHAHKSVTMLFSLIVRICRCVATAAEYRPIRSRMKASFSMYNLVYLVRPRELHEEGTTSTPLFPHTLRMARVPQVEPPPCMPKLSTRYIALATI